MIPIIFDNVCSSRKYPYSPNRRDWAQLGDGRGPKHLKKHIKINCREFTERWGVLEKMPSVGEVWTFSGTTQFGKISILLISIIDVQT